MTRPMLFPLVTLLVAGLILGLWGCTGGAGDTTTLDSTLTRTDALVEAGKDREARQYLRAALETHTDIREGKAMAAGSRMLAELYAASALYDSARVFYDRAAEAYRGLAQRANAYAMVIAAGDLDIRSGRPDRTRVRYEEALRLAQVFGDSASAHALRLALVPVYAAVEDRSAERDALSRLYATARARQDRGSEAQIEYAAGLASAGRGENDDAAAAFLRTVTLADGAGDSLLATKALMQVGITLDRAGQTREALATFGSALARSALLRYHTDLASELLVRVGNCYLRTRDFPQATRFFRSAATIANASRDALLEAYLMMQLGHASFAADRTAALQSYRSGYDQFRSFRYAPGTAYALSTLAAVAEREGRLTDALQLATAAVAEEERTLALRAPSLLYPDCERSTLFEPGEEPSQRLVALLLQLSRTDEAFAAQQRRNAYAMMRRLSPGVFRTGTADADSVLAFCADQQALHRGAEYQQERVLTGASTHGTVRDDILGVMARTTTGVMEAAEDIARLAPAYLPLARVSGEVPSEVQKRVPPNSALLTYIPGRRSVSAALITPAGSAVRVSVQPPEKITQAIEAYMVAMRAQTVEGEGGGTPRPARSAEVQALTRTLYEALLLPVEPLLKPGTRLFVLFPEGMQPFPVHALRRAPVPGSPYLIERFPVQYLTDLRFPSVSTPSVPAVVTCAGVAGTSLWDVEYELRDVRFFFKDARMLFHRDVTLDSIRAVRSDVLHCALQMDLGVRSPLAGRFHLSDGESREGTRSYPLATLTTFPPARTVVMSSLTSRLPSFDPLVPFALGANGSGVIVMNVFMPTRGAKKAFGEAFYTGLLQGMAAEAAVQRAQVEMIRGKQFTSPAAWGAFMAYGMN